MLINNSGKILFCGFVEEFLVDDGDDVVLVMGGLSFFKVFYVFLE